MNNQPENTVSLDSSEWTAAIEELKLNIPKAPLEVFETSLRLFDFPSEWCRIEWLSTVGTLNVMALKPSDRFRDFLAALRAIKGERLAIKEV